MQRRSFLQAMLAAAAAPAIVQAASLMPTRDITRVRSPGVIELLSARGEVIARVPVRDDIFDVIGMREGQRITDFKPLVLDSVVYRSEAQFAYLEFNGRGTDMRHVTEITVPAGLRIDPAWRVKKAA